MSMVYTQTKDPILKKMLSNIPKRLKTHKESQHDWYIKNKEKAKQSCYSWRRSHIEQVRKYQRKYYQTYKHKVRENNIKKKIKDYGVDLIEFYTKNLE